MIQFAASHSSELYTEQVTLAVAYTLELNSDITDVFHGSFYNVIHCQTLSSIHGLV